MTTNMSHADLKEVCEQIDRVMLPRRHEFVEAVREALREVLGIDTSNISDTANLVRDLGIESLDTLDVIFRLEMRYGVKIPRGGIRQLVEAGLDSQLEHHGRLTDEALERLRIIMPEVSTDHIVPGLSAHSIPDLFTVETLGRLVAWRLAEKGD